jgi:hypothetical protein
MYNNPSLLTSSAWALIAKARYSHVQPYKVYEEERCKTVDACLSVLYTRSRSRVVNNPVLHMSLKGVV